MTSPDTTPRGVPDAAGEAAWRAAVARVLKGGSFDARLVTRTLDGIAVQPLYPAADVPAPSGARPPCRVFARLDADDVPPGEDVANGADGLVLAFAGSGPARGFGLDPAALAAALEGIAVGSLPLRLEPAPFGGLEAVRALLDLAQARGIDPAALALDGGIDPLGFMARTGAAPNPWPVLSGLVAEVVAAVRGAGLAGPLLLADGRPHHEAGASEAQELAAVLATGVAYLRLLDAAGTPPDAGRASLSFLLAADADEVMTVAKFRALRRLWARVEADCGLDAAPIRLHGETSWRMLTRRDPPTNLLRNALACAGAMLGGADGIAVLPHTAALGLPDAGARRLARNTALVLRDEAGLDRVADPAAGSGAFEALTEGLCAAAWDLFAETERSGGLATLLVDGAWAMRLAVTQGRRVAELGSGARTLVGTSAYPLAEEPPPTVLRPAPPPAPRAAGALPCLRDDQLFGPEGATPMIAFS